MHNVTYDVIDDKLVITVDVSATALATAPPSASGKTRLVGSTGGACPIPSVTGAAMTFSLNVMMKA